MNNRLHELWLVKCVPVNRGWCFHVNVPEQFVSLQIFSAYLFLLPIHAVIMFVGRK